MRCEVDARIDHELGQSQPHCLEIRLANRRLRVGLARGFRNRVAPVLLDLGDVGGGAGGDRLLGGMGAGGNAVCPEGSAAHS